MIDKDLEYKSLIYKIEKTISNIKKLGIDTDEYIKRLNEITSEVENGILKNSLYDEATNGMFLIQTYSNGISKLKKLELLLDKYNVYFKSINTAYYVDSQIAKEKKEMKVDLLVDNIIETLKQIRNSDTVHYKDEEKVVEKVYEVAYKVVKLEIITSGKSKIFEFCKDYDVDLYFFDKCVNKELSTLDLNDSKYSKVVEKIYELDSKGYDNSYFDLNLIKLLLCYGDDSLSIKEDVLSEMTKLVNRAVDYSDETKRLTISLSNEQGNLNSNRDKLLSIRKDFCKRLTSLLLTVSLFVGGGLGAHFLSKKIATSKNYKRTITTYSEWNGLNRSEDLISNIFNGDEEDTTYIKVYGAWEEGTFLVLHSNYHFRRTINTYNVSNFEFENIEDYLKQSLDSYGVDCDTKFDYANYVSQLYNNEYVEVEKTTIDKSQEIIKYSKGLNWGLFIFFYAIYVVVLAITYQCKYYYFSDFKYDLQDLVDKFREYFHIRKLSNDQLNNLRALSDELLGYINSNEELKLKFNELYEGNKYLLDNSEELYNKFNEISSKINASEIKESASVKKLTKGKA